MSREPDREDPRVSETEAPQPEDHPYGGVEPRWSPAQLAEALGGNLPTEQQAEVIAAPLSPRLVVAGAGSGKTATMVDRVVWLVANGIVGADQILGVTFTRKAAGELRDRVRGRLGVLRAQGLLVPSPVADTPPEDDEFEAETGAHEAGDGASEHPVPLEPTVLTYHSYASYLVRTYGLRIGVEPETGLLGQAQAWQLAARTVESWDGEITPDLKVSTAIGEVLALSSGAAEHLLAPSRIRDVVRDLADRVETTPRAQGSRKRTIGKQAQDAVRRMRRTALITQMTERFQEAKRASETMDFGDLLALAARLAQEDPACAGSERDRFRVVLLDEFQDTSHAQMAIFARLYGAGHSVMAVGDPQQSIYGFRGASSGQLFGFGRHFPSGGPAREAVSFLSVAWRNDTAILAAANRVAGPLRVLPPWTATRPDQGLQEVPELAARPGAGTGRVRLSRHLSDDDEARAIAEEIASSHGSSAPDEPPPSTAVLCRRRAQFETVRRELAAREIPYEVVGLGGLLQVPEVEDIVATLRVLVDPSRSDALTRLLTGARWRLGARDLVALADWAGHLERRRTAAARSGTAEQLEDDAVPELEGPAAAASGAAASARARREAAEDVLVEPDLVDAASLVEAVETLPRPGWVSGAGRSLTETARQRLEAFARELAELRTWLAEDLPTVISVIERRLGLDIEVASRPGARAEEGRRNLDALLDTAASFSSASGTHDAGAFLSWLDVAAREEAPDVAAAEPRPGAVQLLTVHAAKGLEWDHVHVPGMNDGSFPSRRDPSWLKHPEAVPWPLRGDRDFLPQWSADTADLEALQESLEQFGEDAAQYAEDEERRLAYVAFTRARRELHLSSTIYSGTAKTPAKPSPFLGELLELSEPRDGAPAMLELGTWVEPAEGQENPALSRSTESPWPYDPLEGPEVTELIGDPAAPEAPPLRVVRPPLGQGRRAQLETAARAVASGGFAGLEGTDGAGGTDGTGAGEDSEEDRLLEDPRVAQWVEEARILLAAHQQETEVQELPLPSHLSASTVVALGRDPRAVAAQIRRPMPRRPGTAARAGTAFHAWLEERFGSSAIFDADELPGGADDFVDEAFDLPRLTEIFRAGAWGTRQPWAVEHAIETPIGGLTIRGRIDAVFRDDDGSWELVDWKTGAMPSGRELAERAVQLAVYRLGWSRLQGVPLDQVSAAFYYVAADRTIRPHDLADEAQLEHLVRSSFG